MKEKYMRRYCAIWLLVLIGGAYCNVGFAQEEILFELLISPDATVSIKNVSDESWTLEGYSLISVARALDEDGWYPIGQQFLDDPDRIVSLLGDGFLDGNIPFGDLSTDASQRLTEFGSSGPNMYWGANLTIPIGKPLGEDVDQIRALVESGGIEWHVHFFLDLIIDKQPIWFIPEPSGLALAGLAALGLLIAGRRPFLANARRRLALGREAANR